MDEVLHILRFGELDELRHAHPEIDALYGTPQDPEWHPEGDAGVHTACVIKAMQKIIARDGILFGSHREAVLLFAALCHDLGKPATTTRDDDGRIRARGHDEAGVEPTRAVLERMGVPQVIIEDVVALVRLHMVHLWTSATVANVKRILVQLGTARLDDLDRLVEADISGRPPLPARKAERLQEYLALAWDAHRALEEQAKADRRRENRIITGQVLLAAGIVPPGPTMGQLIRWLDLVQEDAGFSTVDEGLALARTYLEAMQ